jgi:hypothetical protein
MISAFLVAETLARYAINLKYEDLPQDVVRTAKRRPPHKATRTGTPRHSFAERV